MTEEQKYDLIERYLAGDLAVAAKEKFEQQLQTDADLQATLALHRQVAESLKGEKVHQFRAALQAVDQDWQAPETQKDKPKKVFSLSRMISLAAAILLLVFAYQVWWSTPKVSSSDLFAANFQTYKMVLNQRSVEERDSLYAPMLQSAAAAYEQRDFETAAKQFAQLQTARPDILAFQFYRAISALALKDNALAVSLLEKLQVQERHLFSEQSQWYLALAYLQKGETAKARKSLLGIKKGTYQYAAAQEILSRL